MSPERWQQLQSLYHAALERDVAQREAFLAEACATDGGLDEALRREVEVLLAAHAHASNFLPTAGLARAVAQAVTDQPADRTGQKISRYRLLSRLGAGGMGEVWLADDPSLQRKVAVKLLPPEFNADDDRVLRFEQEARAASALNHPHIITIHEVGQAADTYYLVTEYVEGRTLRDLLAQGALPVATALDLTAQVASALAAAHEAGIVHRDIKPENVMVRRDGLVKVLDFGLAKLLKVAGQTIDTEAPTRPLGQKMVQTQSGFILGTLNYLSPEQARGKNVDARTDIFSLGILLYELVTATRPFSGETPSDLIASILKTEPPPLASHLPQGLQAIIDRALQKEQQARYPSAQAMLDDLKRLKQRLDYEAEWNDTAKLVSQNSPLASPAIHTDETRVLPTNLLSGAVVTPPTTSAVKVSTARKWWMALTIGVVLSGLAWLWFGRSNQPADAALRLAALKTTELVNWSSTPGEVYSAGTFSPDGKRIAYASTESGAKSIWVKQVKEGSNPVRITTDEFRNENPIWSPDGEELAYFSLRGNRYGIWRIPYLGGNPTELVQLNEGGVELSGWAKSNTIYYQIKGNLFALDVAQRTASQITQFDRTKAEISSIQISPDETRIAYRGADEQQTNTLWVMPKAGGNAVAVASHPAEIRNIVWHPDGKRLLYSANVEGSYQIYLAYTDGRPSVPITSGNQEAFVLDAANDGKILVGSSKEESDVWGVNLAKPGEFAVAADINAELWPAVSADGQTLAFQSIHNLSQGDKLTTGSIVVKAVTGVGHATELVTNGYLPQWSPDGRQLAFLRLEGKTTSLLRVDATGGKESVVAMGALRTEYSILPYNRTQISYFQWSPDGNKLVYGSKKNGQQNLWLANPDGSDDRPLTKNTDANLLLHCPVWSANGKRVAYLAKTDKVGPEGKVIFSVWVIDVATSEAKMLYQANAFIRLLGWSSEGKSLLLATLDHQPVTGTPTAVSLLQVAITDGAARMLANLTATYLFNVHLSPEGQRIAYVARRDGKDNLWVLPTSGGTSQKLTTNQDARLYFSSLAWSPDSKAIYFGKQSRYSLLTMISNLN